VHVPPQEDGPQRPQWSPGAHNLAQETHTTARRAPEVVAHTGRNQAYLLPTTNPGEAVENGMHSVRVRSTTAHPGAGVRPKTTPQWPF
jgi:hypothetical protein